VHPLLTPHLDVQRVKLSILDATLLRVTFETRGQVPPEGDRAMEGIGYRVDFDASEPRPAAPVLLRLGSLKAWQIPTTRVVGPQNTSYPALVSSRKQG